MLFQTETPPIENSDSNYHVELTNVKMKHRLLRSIEAVWLTSGREDGLGLDESLFAVGSGFEPRLARCQDHPARDSTVAQFIKHRVDFDKWPSGDLAVHFAGSGHFEHLA